MSCKVDKMEEKKSTLIEIDYDSAMPVYEQIKEGKQDASLNYSEEAGV